MSQHLPPRSKRNIPPSNVPVTVIGLLSSLYPAASGIVLLACRLLIFVLSAKSTGIRRAKIVEARPSNAVGAMTERILAGYMGGQADQLSFLVKSKNE